MVQIIVMAWTKTMTGDTEGKTNVHWQSSANINQDSNQVYCIDPGLSGER